MTRDEGDQFVFTTDELGRKVRVGLTFEETSEWLLLEEAGADSESMDPKPDEVRFKQLIDKHYEAQKALFAAGDEYPKHGHRYSDAKGRSERRLIELGLKPRSK